jgi:hypothetical protein
VSRVDRDEELALLGVLEAQLGQRQQSLAGLHIEEDASRTLHAEMVALQHRATELEAEREAAEREAAEQRAESPGTPRHRKPKRGLHG